MKDHTFQGKVDELGTPVVAQVDGAPTGALAQVCDTCGGTAAENGQTPDHPAE